MSISWEDLPKTVESLRALGVRRVVFGMHEAVIEIELEPPHPDTIPAPSPFEPDDLAPPEEKAAGICAIPGCNERAGFHFAPHMCERHGLSQLGVKQ